MAAELGEVLAELGVKGLALMFVLLPLLVTLMLL